MSQRWSQSVETKTLQPGSNKVGEPSSKNEFKPVVMKPKHSSFKFTEKQPMKYDFSPPRPDSGKLMEEDILDYKETNDVVRRARMAKIYRHGELLCVVMGHPGFDAAKREEILRLSIKAREKKAAKAQKDNEKVKSQVSNEEKAEGERKEWQTGHKKKAHAKRPNDDDSEQTGVKTQSQPTKHVEEFIVNPNLN